MTRTFVHDFLACFRLHPGFPSMSSRPAMWMSFWNRVLRFRYVVVSRAAVLALEQFTMHWMAPVMVPALYK